jgi:hypothetical protein
LAHRRWVFQSALLRQVPARDNREPATERRRTLPSELSTVSVRSTTRRHPILRLYESSPCKCAQLFARRESLKRRVVSSRTERSPAAEVLEHEAHQVGNQTRPQQLIPKHGPALHVDDYLRHTGATSCHARTFKAAATDSLCRNTVYIMCVLK